MGNHRAFSLDDLVRTKLSFTGNHAVKAVDVGTPTLNTPTTGDENPLEWLHNPVGLEPNPRHTVTWEESGNIINPQVKILAYVIA
jgi:hypothetical protein